MIPWVAVAGLTAVGIVVAHPHDSSLTAEPAAVTPAASTPSRDVAPVSRSDHRSAVSAKAKVAVKANATDRAQKKEAKKATTVLAALPLPERGRGAGTRYASTALNVRPAPEAAGDPITTVATGTKIAITSVTVGEWRQVVVRDKTGYVKASYLTAKKPAKATSAGSDDSGSDAGVRGGACPSGSGVERGLQPYTIKAHRAICHAFPMITSYGGVRADSLPAHPTGHALDSMIPNYSSASGNALGWRIAKWARAHASELGITEVIFDQHIWTTQRSGEGWRSMSDRGGATANHRDHVHVTCR